MPLGNMRSLFHRVVCQGLWTCSCPHGSTPSFKELPIHSTVTCWVLWSQTKHCWLAVVHCKDLTVCRKSNCGWFSWTAHKYCQDLNCPQSPIFWKSLAQGKAVSRVLLSTKPFGMWDKAVGEPGGDQVVERKMEAVCNGGQHVSPTSVSERVWVAPVTEILNVSTLLEDEELVLSGTVMKEPKQNLRPSGGKYKNKHSKVQVV